MNEVRPHSCEFDPQSNRYIALFAWRGEWYQTEPISRKHLMAKYSAGPAGITIMTVINEAERFDRLPAWETSDLR
jgi:hypothetical protein